MYGRVDLHVSLDVFKAYKDIICSISEVNLRGLSENIPWSTFEILLSLINTSTNTISRCVADKLGVPELPEDIQKARLSHSQLNKMWENVLAVLRDGMVPLKTLHEAIIKNLQV